MVKWRRLCMVCFLSHGHWALNSSIMVSKRSKAWSWDSLEFIVMGFMQKYDLVLSTKFNRGSIYIPPLREVVCLEEQTGGCNMLGTQSRETLRSELRHNQIFKFSNLQIIELLH